jgi:predicted chitinase
VHFSLTEQEFAALQDAAGRAGLARGAFAAQVVLAAGLVRRIGVNLNQAVAGLNATGQRSGDLLLYARESMRRAGHLDEVAEEVRKALR